MARLFADQCNIHKLAHYIPVYDTTFSPYRGRPITMLEIGVSFGGSLELWRRYFPPEAIIVGVDSNPGCAALDAPARNLFVRIGLQQDPVFLRALVDEFGPFDIILDDGSHLPSFTLAAFKFLFPNGL